MRVGDCVEGMSVKTVLERIGRLLDASRGRDEAADGKFF